MFKIHLPLLLLPVSQQVKKSGKDPKVGADVTLGEMSRKTTVRPQTSFSSEMVASLREWQNTCEQYWLTLASSKVCDRTTSPQWNEAFCFLVRDPREDILVVKVWWLLCIITHNRVGQMSVIQKSVISDKYSYANTLHCISPALPHLDIAHWFPGGAYQRAALWTWAGPRPVVPSGWSLTWESGSSESRTQGRRILRLLLLLLFSVCFIIFIL